MISKLFILRTLYDSLKLQLSSEKKNFLELNDSYLTVKDRYRALYSDKIILSTENKVFKCYQDNILKELEACKQKLDNKLEKIIFLESTVSSKSAMVQSCVENKVLILQDNKELKSINTMLSKNFDDLKDRMHSEISGHQIKIAELGKQLRSEQDSYKEKINLLEHSKVSLTQQFENLANRIFDEKERKFLDLSQFNLDQVLSPFKEELIHFKKRINDIYHTESQDRSSLKQEVNKLFDLSQQINEESQNLSKALLGNKKIQGYWGEMLLERTLEASGLRKSYEYETQVTLKNEKNEIFRPDVIVHLPDNKDVIIDSKVSLVNYEMYINSDTDIKRSYNLKKHVDAIYQHINFLSCKNYEDLLGINSLDFVLMFIPIESAFVSALHHDNSLITKAFKKRIVIVTPTTLLATLSIIRYTWKYQQIDKNSNEIARRATLMFDKFRCFIEDIEALGKNIDKSKDIYEQILSKLSRGRGNLVNQVSKLQSLGVFVKKELPRNLLDGSEID